MNRIADWKPCKNRLVERFNRISTGLNRILTGYGYFQWFFTENRWYRSVSLCGGCWQLSSSCRIDNCGIFKRISWNLAPGAVWERWAWYCHANFTPVSDKCHPAVDSTVTWRNSSVKAQFTCQLRAQHPQGPLHTEFQPRHLNLYKPSIWQVRDSW